MAQQRSAEVAQRRRPRDDSRACTAPSSRPDEDTVDIEIADGVVTNLAASGHVASGIEEVRRTMRTRRTRRDRYEDAPAADDGRPDGVHGHRRKRTSDCPDAAAEKIKTASRRCSHRHPKGRMALSTARGAWGTPHSDMNFCPHLHFFCLRERPTVAPPDGRDPARSITWQCSHYRS